MSSPAHVSVPPALSDLLSDTGPLSGQPAVLRWAAGQVVDQFPASDKLKFDVALALLIIEIIVSVIAACPKQPAGNLKARAANMDFLGRSRLKTRIGILIRKNDESPATLGLFAFEELRDGLADGITGAAAGAEVGKIEEVRQAVLVRVEKAAAKGAAGTGTTTA